MRSFFLIVLIVGLGFSNAARASTIEIDIHGMTCAFCVDALKRGLSKLSNIDQVDVSLKDKKIRIAASTKLDIDTIKKIIINSGFTPIEIRTVDDGKN